MRINYDYSMRRNIGLSIDCHALTPLYIYIYWWDDNNAGTRRIGRILLTILINSTIHRQIPCKTIALALPGGRHSHPFNRFTPVFQSLRSSRLSSKRVKRRRNRNWTSIFNQFYILLGMYKLSLIYCNYFVYFLLGICICNWNCNLEIDICIK